MKRPTREQAGGDAGELGPHAPGWSTTVAELGKLGDAGRLALALARGGRRLPRDTTGKHAVEFASFAKAHSFGDRQGWFFPETWFYGDALKRIHRDEVVFEACAGNLALAVAMSAKARRVDAVEINPHVLAMGTDHLAGRMPQNLSAVCGDAYDVPVPSDTTLIVCLAQHFPGMDMRHGRIVEGWRGRTVLGNFDGYLCLMRDYPHGISERLADPPATRKDDPVASAKQELSSLRSFKRSFPWLAGPEMDAKITAAEEAVRRAIAATP